MLARIGHALPCLGDPYRIALVQIAERYADAVDVMHWQRGEADTEEDLAERKRQADARRLRQAARARPS
jgi:ABC-type sugar transport system substrate-binding protein